MEAKKGKAFVVLKAVLDPFATSYQLQKTQFSYRTPSQNYAQNGFDVIQSWLVFQFSSWLGVNASKKAFSSG